MKDDYFQSKMYRLQMEKVRNIFRKRKRKLERLMI